jgi:hypothetical protein
VPQSGIVRYIYALTKGGDFKIAIVELAYAADSIDIAAKLAGVVDIRTFSHKILLTEECCCVFRGN